MTEAFDVARVDGRWRIEHALTKLRQRGALAGAYNYDLTAHALRQAVNAGVPRERLLAPAMPGSWMVNNRAPSSVLKAWLSDEARPAWQALFHHLEEGPEEWVGAGADARETVTQAVEALSRNGHQTCAVSKVLALLCPETVPLMDDAALFLMTGGAPMPKTADTPEADASAFVPMLDTFNRAVLEAEPALLELADHYELAPLTASQVLDRLLWFDSWGHRVVKAKWRRVEEDGLVTVSLGKE